MANTQLCLGGGVFTSMHRFRLAVLLATIASLVAVLPAASASAAYRGKNGELAWESFASTDDGGPPPPQETDAIETRSRTLAYCDGTSGPLPCEFGPPSYSPDGRSVVFSRLVPTNAVNDQGDQGQLEIVNSDGSDPRILPRETADDEHPAFLPSESGIVFDGRTSESATPNLYTVATDGGGLFQLTTAGGSEPAPCTNGTIAFVRNANIYLLHPNSGDVRQLTRSGGGSPSCAPNSHQIAFVRGDTLYTIGSAGRHLHRVTKTPASAPTYSPDGTELAFLTSYNVPSENGSQVALKVVNLKGRPAQPKIVVANSSFSGDSGIQANGYAAGIGWQPAIASKIPVTRVKGSPLSSTQLYDIDAVALSPDDRLLAGVEDDGQVALFSIRYTGGVVTRFKLLPPSQAPPTRPLGISVAFSPVADLLAIGLRGGLISEYAVNPTTGALTAAPGSPVAVGNGRDPSALAFSPSGRLLAAATTGGGVSVFSVDQATGALTPAPGSPFAAAASAAASSVAWDAGASRLAAAWPGAAWVFSVDPSTGVLTPVAGSPVGNQTGWSTVAFTPDGRLLGASADGAGVLVIDPASPPSALPGSPFLPIDDLAFTPTAKAFSPNGQLLAAAIGHAGNGFSGVALASIAPAAVEPSPTAFSSGANTVSDSIAFSPDGELLATGNVDGTVSLFTIGGASIACHVPNVRGRSLRVASRRLRSSRCSRGRVRIAPGARPPLVVGAQTPGAGALEPHGERVALRLIQRP
jgi:WD40 repeat protein